MDDLVDDGREVISVEYFAAKDNSGLIMAVPKRCGLNKASSLEIKGLAMVAMSDGRILPIDMPQLTVELREKLVNIASRGLKLHVGEFMARGCFDAYSLELVIL